MTTTDTAHMVDLWPDGGWAVDHPANCPERWQCGVVDRVERSLRRRRPGPGWYEASIGENGRLSLKPASRKGC